MLIRTGVWTQFPRALFPPWHAECYCVFQIEFMHMLTVLSVGVVPNIKAFETLFVY
jgi:hypothetical protein